MRMLRTVLVFVLLSAGIVSAQPARVFLSYDGGYESITVATTAIGITRAVYAPVGAGFQAQMCFASLETAEVRYRYDGASPSSSEGHILAIAGQIAIYGTANIAKFKAIRTGGTSGTLKVTCSA